MSRPWTPAPPKVERRERTGYSSRDSDDYSSKTL
jgi:hypothetical protein